MIGEAVRSRRLRLSSISRPGMIGMALMATLLVGVLAASIASPEPGAQDLARILEAPGSAQPMGTDQLGRDQLSRVAAGVRNSLLTVVVVLAVSGIGGGLVGLYSGYRGGTADLLLQRAVDALMAMPLVVLALAVAAAAGTSFWSVTLAIAVAFAPLSIRVTRSSALSLRNADYVASARLSGASTGRIVLRHLAPNAIGPWAIVAASQAGAAVLVEAALAFLGIAPGRITLGGLLGGEAQTYMYSASWLIIWPGVTLGRLALSVNVLGEWIADSVTSRPVGRVG